MQNIIGISDFNEIVNGLKGMKADFVCVNGNLLIGTDTTNTYIKTYKMNTIIPISPFTLCTKELSSEFYANITDTSIIINFDTGKLYCPNNTLFADSRTNRMITDNLFTNNILYRYNNLELEKNNSYHIEYGEITNDESFQLYKALKSADGTYLYNPKDTILYQMYLYNGAIPVNKMDKVFLEIYDYPKIFISKFIVYKKKLNPIEVYFKFVKLK